MKKMIIPLIFLAVSGCATVGNDISSTEVQKIQKGVTTEQSLISMFGQPSATTIDSEGNKILLWSYGHAVAFGPAVGKSLSVKLNHDGVVESYSSALPNPQPVKMYQ
ncbi:hypothetical protein ACL2XP_17950 [Sodalis sp. RH21]|uniref:hypothetical protein n=1 Tax=unclassified Sodalis (in: enterobacteria) TaxID=2636512 RepID=UPI0039B44D38